jgi:hypothetical protein
MPAHAVVVEIGYITSYAYEAVDVSQVPFWSVNNRALRKNQQTFSCNHLPASASLVGVEDRFSNADGGNLKVGLAFDQGCVRVTDVHKFVLKSDHLPWLQRAQGKKSNVKPWPMGRDEFLAGKFDAITGQASCSVVARHSV